jgi:hypothetical protein
LLTTLNRPQERSQASLLGIGNRVNNLAQLVHRERDDYETDFKASTSGIWYGPSYPSKFTAVIGNASANVSSISTPLNCTINHQERDE